MTFTKTKPTSTKLSFAFVDVNVLGPAVQSLICARVTEEEVIRF